MHSPKRATLAGFHSTESRVYWPVRAGEWNFTSLIDDQIKPVLNRQIVDLIQNTPTWPRSRIPLMTLFLKVFLFLSCQLYSQEAISHPPPHP